jgi:hypothetical protein
VHVQARTAANRRLLADFFDNLDDHQLATRSLCSDWSVRDVLGHLVAAMTGRVGGLLRDVVRARGSLDRANATAVQRTAVPTLRARIGGRG